jgi:hypothetical protein
VSNILTVEERAAGRTREPVERRLPVAASIGLVDVEVTIFVQLLFRADDDDIEEDKVVVHGKDRGHHGELGMVSSRAEDAEVGDAWRAGEEEADLDFFFGRRKRRGSGVIGVIGDIGVQVEEGPGDANSSVVVVVGGEPAGKRLQGAPGQLHGMLPLFGFVFGGAEVYRASAY